MIESFLICSANGFKRTPGVFPDGVSKMELFKPEYTPTQYEWISNGVTHTRKLDSTETRSMLMTPNRRYFVVEQSPDKYGSDNLLILREDGTEERRLKNPYSASPEFNPEATYEFREARVFGERILALISASWKLQHRPGYAEPVYATLYDCDTWESTPLEFVNSKDL
jgi:hypothetical protein